MIEAGYAKREDKTGYLQNNRPANDFQITEHFSLKEFECPCCHTVMLLPKLAFKLQELRDKLSHPLIVNSGYRCPIHNLRVKGISKSAHMEGKAADILVLEKEQAIFCKTALNLGFLKAIAYGKRNFVHLEVGG